jgi:type I restriction enzyme S subunit
MTRLRDLGDWQGGNTPSKANSVYWTDGTIPWVSPKDMKVDEITSSQDRVSEEALKQGRVSMVPEGSVLVVTRSGILSHTLPVAVTKTPVTINQDLKALTPKPGVLPEYVAHALRGAGRRILKECSKHGTTVASIETSALLDFEIPIVDVDEQCRIVAELEKQFSRLDEAVANLKRVKANLKRYKAAVLTDAVEGELAGDRTEWRPVRLGGIATSVRNGISIKPVGESGTRILRISAVRPMTLDLDEIRYLAQPHDEFDSFRLATGDVLFTRYNGSVDLVGVCAAVPEMREPTVYPDKLIRVRVPSDELLPAFLVITASTGEARAFIGSRIRTTAGQAGVSGSDIKAIPLRVPPPQEQRRIVAEVDRRLSIVREVEVEVDANLKRAQALRQAVLARAFTGSGAAIDLSPNCRGATSCAEPAA